MPHNLNEYVNYVWFIRISHATSQFKFHVMGVSDKNSNTHKHWNGSGDLDKLSIGSHQTVKHC